MRKLLTIIALILCAHYSSIAQSPAVQGVVSDTINSKVLDKAVISILRSTDSVLLAFARSGPDGSFRVNNIPPGKHILKITYPKYADYVDFIQANAGEPINVGRIGLILKSQLLQEVVVSQKIGAIRIKGDTMEYKADSFKVQAGANVEDLLKKLPGIQVNKNGEITAQGEKVQKVLVDGEEFFSDDPAVVTQNLQADAVKTVQVFDKKSDQAAFTGIDDGEKTKTINLQLKEDRKKGYFGKAKVAGGTPGNFENEGMINAFKGKRKIAAFGTMSNTGKAGLNWEDSEKFGGGSGMTYIEDEGYFISTFENDEFNTWGGRYNGEGFPTTWTGGTHYSNKWNADKNHVNLNYRYNKQNLEIAGSRINQTILPKNQYFGTELRNTRNQNMRHAVNGFYDIKLDSFSSLKVSVNGSKTTGRSSANYESTTRDEQGKLVNTSSRTLTSEGDKNNFISSLLFRHKFRKQGRTFSVTLDQVYALNETNGFLTFDNDIYDSTGNLLQNDTVDQRKLNKIESFSFNSKASYTEPLSKTTFLEFNYGYRVNNSEALRNTFNKSFNGNDPKYESRDTLYSNDYAFRINTQSGGINLRVNQKQVVYSFGGNISHSAFRQTDLETGALYTYSFVNFFPRANFRYNLGPQRRITLAYNGNTRQPTLEQIQPVLENTDPLNIQIGNANLKQEFRHNLNLNFNDYKVLTSRSIFMGLNFSFTDNAISSSSLIDSVNRRTNQFVNVDGNYYGNLWAGMWTQIKKWKIHVGMNIGGSISRYNNFVNGEKNTNDNQGFNSRIDLWHEKENKYFFRFAPFVTYTKSRSSLRKEVVTKFWTSETEMEGRVHLPLNFEVGSSVTYSYRQQTSVFDRDLNATRWNAHLAKKFWKNKSGEIRLSVFDILDQNIGFQRNASSNFISENTYNTIRRYWLIGFTWNFSKSPGQAAAK